MAHPYRNEARDSGKARVAHITKGYARGGKVEHSDEAQDKKLIKKMIAESEASDEGKKSNKFARGGKVKGLGKGLGKTNVNVIVANKPKSSPEADVPAPGADMPPPPVPVPVPTAKPVMAVPPVPLPGGGAGPMSMPMRKRGGSVKEEGIRNGTQISHSTGKNDLDDIRTKPPITRKNGGSLGMTAGAESGEGRLQKTEIQKKAR